MSGKNKRISREKTSMKIKVVVAIAVTCLSGAAAGYAENGSNSMIVATP